MFEEVERLPGAPQLHRWADWAELLAYTSATGTLSMPELAETTERRTDFIASESEDDQDSKDPESEPLVQESVGEPAAYRDALAQRAGDVLSYLLDRASRYGAAYPFEIDPENRTLSLRAPSDSRRIYILLLACACLRYVGKTDRTKLTARFELLGLETMKRLLPPEAEVHLFGKNPLARGRYPTLLVDKISQLAADLGEQVRATASDFEPGDQGDNGLDLVAWIPFNDALPGKVTIFAQAACTPEWVSKQHSSHASSWSSVMTLTADPVNMVLIPYDYRRPNDDWYTRRHIHKSVVVDRYRMIGLLSTGPDSGDPIVLDQELLDALDLARLDDVRQQESADL
ncbi:hypothetical protein [Microbacterium sp.]|uniref:hypothetical protein n=1 Tax=Microbacterium sp. TaxID=51671 RepID=UPI001AC406AF|nr:hypothetical protein [Microbacterium sp.]MBN9156913.1 hypothetical protein [Microbacterium sp.]